MKIEVRADNTVHISGYVNAVERESRPVVTPRGKVNEVISQRAFENALSRVKNVPMTVDHLPDRAVASTEDGTLKLYEDGIGLYADSVVSDGKVAEQARAGKIKGWSFGMTNVKDEVEQREGKLPLRRIRELDLDHITLAIEKTPVYSATSVEVRADCEIDLETRACGQDVFLEIEEEKKPSWDYSPWERRIEQLKKG